MALRDPELLAVAASAVGADALMTLLGGSTPLTEERAPPELHDPYYQPHRQLQRHAPPMGRLPEGEDETKLLQQEMELAQLQQEAEATKRLIMEVRREAEEATTGAAAATAHAAAHAQQTVEPPDRRKQGKRLSGKRQRGHQRLRRRLPNSQRHKLWLMPETKSTGWLSKPQLSSKWSKTRS